MPKVKTLQIVWHGKEPVYSLDIHSNGNKHTLVTAGGDKEIKFWNVKQTEDGSPTVEHIHSLGGHEKTVNCVRFSPTGSALVSAGDGGEMLLFQPSAPGVDWDGWKRTALMKGHADDVMDLSWASDGTALISGSIDNRVLAWEVSNKRKGVMLTQLNGHKHFVQGVAYDPAQQFAVSQSADRTCKVYGLRPAAGGKKGKIPSHLLPACEAGKEFYQLQTLSKQTVKVLRNGEEKVERVPLFHDESIASFFRRLAWSPDGSFLVVPAGLQPPTEGSTKDAHTVYVYARGNWTSPVAQLPGHSKPVVAVRFCPTVFERDADAAVGSPFDLPYKMIYAVATLDSVVIYDTDHTEPLAVFGHLHYDSITDLAWSKDGKYLAIASRDCYCSIAVFDDQELGKKSEQGITCLPQRNVENTAAAAQATVQLENTNQQGVVQANTAVAPMDIEQQQHAVPPSATKPPKHPAAVGGDGTTITTVNGKRRITPTPLSNQAQVDRFGNAKQASQPPPAETQEQPKNKGRRITPIAITTSPGGVAAASPIMAASNAAAGASSEPGSGKKKGAEKASEEKPADKEEAAPPAAAAGFSIAAMAMAAGQQAAQDS